MCGVQPLYISYLNRLESYFMHFQAMYDKILTMILYLVAIYWLVNYLCTSCALYISLCWLIKKKKKSFTYIPLSPKTENQHRLINLQNNHPKNPTTIMQLPPLWITTIYPPPQTIMQLPPPWTVATNQTDLRVLFRFEIELITAKWTRSRCSGSGSS